LIEILIAGALLAFLSIAASRFFSNATKAQKYVSQSYGADSIRQNLDIVLRNQASCAATMSPLNPTVTTPQTISIKDAAANTVIANNTAFSEEGITATSVTASFLQTTGPFRLASIEITLSKNDPDHNKLGRSSWNYQRYINVMITGTTVETCVSGEGGLIGIESFTLNNSPAAAQYTYNHAAANSSTFDAVTNTYNYNRTDINTFCDTTPQLVKDQGCNPVAYATTNIMAKGSYITFQATGVIGANYSAGVHAMVPVKSLTVVCGSTTQVISIAKFGGAPGPFSFAISGVNPPLGFAVNAGDTCQATVKIGWNWVPGPPISPSPTPNPTYATIRAYPVQLQVSHFR